MTERRMRIEVSIFAFFAGIFFALAWAVGGFVPWFAFGIFALITLAGLCAPKRTSKEPE